MAIRNSHRRRRSHYLADTAAHRAHLARLGLTLHEASAALQRKGQGRSATWLSQVLNGHKKSAPVLAAILSITPAEADAVREKLA